jgi:hypothetical protein
MHAVADASAEDRPAAAVARLPSRALFRARRASRTSELGGTVHGGHAGGHSLDQREASGLVQNGHSHCTAPTERLGATYLIAEYSNLDRRFWSCDFSTASSGLSLFDR